MTCEETIKIDSAFKIIRDHIETHPKLNSDRTRLLTAIDSIEFDTLLFSSDEEKYGFNDFLGCFTECHYKDKKHREDWAKGYLRASNNIQVLNNKDHYEGCHFNDAKSIAEHALKSKSIAGE